MCACMWRVGDPVCTIVLKQRSKDSLAKSGLFFYPVDPRD